MIDLGLNQYKIKEIKYEVKENKIVTFKLHNFNLEDVTIEEIAKEETPTEEPDYQPFSSIENYKKPVGEMGAKEFAKSIINYLKEEIPPQGEHPYSRKKKELHDYKPYSCLKNEKGMQEALEASRKKEWMEDVKNHPSTPTDTGNALVPTDISVNEEQIRERSKKLIEYDAKKDTAIIKERVENSIGTNEPLSEEVLKFQEKDFLKDKVVVREPKIPQVIKEVWEKALDEKVYSETISELEKEKENG